MSELLIINGSVVKIGNEDGSVVEVPIASLQFSNPRVGDKVKVFKDNEQYVVTRDDNAAQGIFEGGSDRRRVNKVAYVLLTFFLGGLGVHRFMRGQVGLGLLMIFFGWLTFGIWWLIDFIISLTKLSAFPGDDFIFTADGRFIK